jgi:hypothetical protein
MAKRGVDELEFEDYDSMDDPLGDALKRYTNPTFESDGEMRAHPTDGVCRSLATTFIEQFKYVAQNGGALDALSLLKRASPEDYDIDTISLSQIMRLESIWYKIFLDATLAFISTPSKDDVVDDEEHIEVKRLVNRAIATVQICADKLKSEIQIRALHSPLSDLDDAGLPFFESNSMLFRLEKDRHSPQLLHGIVAHLIKHNMFLVRAGRDTIIVDLPLLPSGRRIAVGTARGKVDTQVPAIFPVGTRLGNALAVGGAMKMVCENLKRLNFVGYDALEFQPSVVFFKGDKRVYDLSTGTSYALDETPAGMWTTFTHEAAFGDPLNLDCDCGDMHTSWCFLHTMHRTAPMWSSIMWFQGLLPRHDDRAHLFETFLHWTSMCDARPDDTRAAINAFFVEGDHFDVVDPSLPHISVPRPGAAWTAQQIAYFIMPRLVMHEGATFDDALKLDAEIGQQPDPDAFTVPEVLLTFTAQQKCGKKPNGILCFVGQSRTSKSTLARILIDTFFPKSRQGTFGGGSEVTFMFQGLTSMEVLYCEEGEKLNGQVFVDLKVIAEHRPKRVAVKNQEAFDWEPDVLLVMCMNDVGQLPNKGNSTVNRLYTVVCEHTVPTKSRRTGLPDLVVKHESAALMKLAHYAMEHRVGDMSLDANQPHCMVKGREQLARDTSKLLRILQDELFFEQDASAKVPTNVLGRLMQYLGVPESVESSSSVAMIERFGGVQKITDPEFYQPMNQTFRKWTFGIKMTQRGIDQVKRRLKESKISECVPTAFAPAPAPAPALAPPLYSPLQSLADDVQEYIDGSGGTVEEAFDALKVPVDQREAIQTLFKH